MRLQLYHTVHCPFSAAVRDFIAENWLTEVELIDVEENADAREYMRDCTGYLQVPCLMIEGRPLLESSEIVNWLEKHLVGPKQHQFRKQERPDHRHL